MDDNYLIATSVEGYIYFYKLSQEYMNNISKDNNLINSTEEKNKINNKLKLLQKFMENENSLSKNEHVKYLIDKFQKSEEATIEDLKLLDSYVKEGKKNQKEENKNKEKEIKPFESQETLKLSKDLSPLLTWKCLCTIQVLVFHIVILPL